MDTLMKKNKNKKKDMEIEEEEKAKMVDIIGSSMENTSLKLNDKDKECRSPPSIFHIMKNKQMQMLIFSHLQLTILEDATKSNR